MGNGRDPENHLPLPYSAMFPIPSLLRGCCWWLQFVYWKVFVLNMFGWSKNAFHLDWFVSAFVLDELRQLCPSFLGTWGGGPLALASGLTASCLLAQLLALVLIGCIFVIQTGIWKGVFICLSLSNAAVVEHNQWWFFSDIDLDPQEEINIVLQGHSNTFINFYLTFLCNPTARLEWFGWWAISP